MRELRLEGASILLGPQVIMNDGLPVQRNQDRRHLILLRPLMECEWNDLFLAMTVQKDLLSEAHVPQAGNDGPQICQECIFGNDNCARHAKMVERMRSVPHRHCYRAS